jgi:hypothetical protein
VAGLVAPAPAAPSDRVFPLAGVPAVWMILAVMASPLHLLIEDPAFRQAVTLLDAGEADALRAHLEGHPGLTRQRVQIGDDGDEDGYAYFRHPSLLEFVAENPVRHDRLPPNIADVTRVILAADPGPDRASLDAALELVSSGRVPRECGVQIALINLLCEHGADPDRAILSALPHGEFEAVTALIAHGAVVDVVVAAATGRADAVERLLPAADAEDRHRALALAAQHGHASVVRVLLEAGEDPSRYNPAGCHSHSTPLHQAALAGHAAVVQMLVEAGARLDVKDTVHSGTPLDWAWFAGQTEIADYLRARMV